MLEPPSPSVSLRAELIPPFSETDSCTTQTGVIASWLHGGDTSAWTTPTA